MHLATKPQHYLLALAIIVGMGAIWLPTRSSAQGSGGWVATNIGGGGAFNHIGAGPTGIIVVGSDLSGAYLSRNRGQSWEPIGATHGLYATHVSSVGFDPTNGSILYLGTDDGLYRSANGGVTFNQVLNNGYIGNLMIAPGDANIGYAAYHPTYNSTNGQLYKSTNRGQSWQQVSTNLPTGLHILKVLVNPQTATDLYLLSGRGRFATGLSQLYRSTNGGVTWQRLASTISDAIMDIAIDPATPSTLYLTTYDNHDNGWDNDAANGLYKSTNSGATWTKLTDRSGSLWLDRSNPTTVRLIDFRFQYTWDDRNGIWESTTGGQSWNRVSSVAQWDGGWSPVYWRFGGSFDGEAKTLGVDLSDPDNLFWVNSQFIFGTFDDGRTVQALHTQKQNNKWQSTGVDNVVPLTIAISPVDPDKIYVGLLDVGCLRTLNGGGTWDLCNEPAYSGAWGSGGGNTWTIVADPTRANVVWASAIDQDNSPGRAYLLKSANSGAVGSWINQSQGLPNTAEFAGLSLDRTSPATNRILFITAAGDVYRSTDDGATWTLSYNCNGCRVTAVDAVDGDLVYAGGENGLFRSINGGATWQAVGPAALRGTIAGMPNNWGWEGVFALASDPNHSGWLYVAAFGNGKGLYRSQDRGATWTKLLSNDFLRSVAVTPGNGQVLYATSSSAFWAGGYATGTRGVLRSTDGGATWSEVNTGLAWPLVLPVAVNPSDPAEVWLGAAGEGFHTQRFSHGTPPTPTPVPPTPTPGPPAASDLIHNGDFSQGAANWSVWGAINATAPGGANGTLCLTFDQRLPKLWDAGVDQYNLALVQGRRYEVRFQAWSQQAAKIRPIVGADEAPYAIYWSQTVTLPANKWRQYSYEFTMGSNDPQSGLFFHVGGHRSPQICLDNVQLLERTPSAISGRVRSDSGAALAGAKVIAYRGNGAQWQKLTQSTTTADGLYTLPNLTPGDYRLRIQRSGYRTEYYQDQSSLAAATTIRVESGATVNLVDIALVPKGRTTNAAPASDTLPGIIVPISDAATGVALDDAIVTLYHLPTWQPRTNPDEGSQPEHCASLATQAADAPWQQVAPVEDGLWVDEQVVAGMAAWQVAAGCYFTTVEVDGYRLGVTPVVGYLGLTNAEQVTVTVTLAPVAAREQHFLPLVQR